MNATVTRQVNELLEKVQTCTSVNGDRIVYEIENKSLLLLKWIPYLNLQKTGIADELLDGALSSLREVAACAGLGLVRPALLAMRTEIELMLSWLYFKDHHIEWYFVNNTGDGFKLKKEILEYLSKYYPYFGSRFGILKDTITRSEVDPYRLLSAHIHSQSLATLPCVYDLKDIVGNKEVLSEIPSLAHNVDEYISDILFATFDKSWTQLPIELLTSVRSRFKTKPQENRFFNGK